MRINHNLISFTAFSQRCAWGVARVPIPGPDSVQICFLRPLFFFRAGCLSLAGGASSSVFSVFSCCCAAASGSSRSPACSVPPAVARADGWGWLHNHKHCSYGLNHNITV